MLERLMNDTFTFVKKDGGLKKEGIKGKFADNQIITFDTSIDVQPNDRFLRSLPSGFSEDFIVKRVEFNSGIEQINPFQQVFVLRSDHEPAPASTIINNIKGDNARININSTDNSVNTVNNNTALSDKVFDDLRSALGNSELDNYQLRIIGKSINEMQEAQGEDNFKEKYKNFMSVAGDHIGIFGTVLTALSLLL